MNRSLQASLLLLSEISIAEWDTMNRFLRRVYIHVTNDKHYSYQTRNCLP